MKDRKTGMDLASIRKAYKRYAGMYDVAFGAVANPGRKRAIAVANRKPGSRVLEVGVGTGLALPMYRGDVRVTGIDLSPEMLARARDKAREENLKHVEALLEMDAENMKFPDASFDTVIAMYVASVVPRPERLMAEMRRVCKPEGDIVVVNHFTSDGGPLRAVEFLINPLSNTLGWRPEFPIRPLLNAAAIEVKSVRRVPPLGIFTVIHCRNVPARAGAIARDTGGYGAIDEAMLAPIGRRSRRG
jgi:phosphatidylethanolamine/phosphatidyl-N-methylethanolamine N-methyltransferase